MKRLSSRAREKLYDAECLKSRLSGLGNLPICVHCHLPIDGTRDRWHEAHDQYRPKFLGGKVVGIAHAECNMQHNNEHDTPLFAKINRVRQKFIGAYRPRSIIPGSRDHWMKKKMNGVVEKRK